MARPGGRLREDLFLIREMRKSYKAGEKSFMTSFMVL
jgi:hypothetical protein